MRPPDITSMSSKNSAALRPESDSGDRCVWIRSVNSASCANAPAMPKTATAVPARNERTILDLPVLTALVYAGAALMFQLSSA